MRQEPIPTVSPDRVGAVDASLGTLIAILDGAGQTYWTGLLGYDRQLLHRDPRAALALLPDRLGQLGTVTLSRRDLALQQRYTDILEALRVTLQR